MGQNILLLLLGLSRKKGIHQRIAQTTRKVPGDNYPGHLHLVAARQPDKRPSLAAVDHSHFDLRYYLPINLVDQRQPPAHPTAAIAGEPCKALLVQIMLL